MLLRFWLSVKHRDHEESTGKRTLAGGLSLERTQRAPESKFVFRGRKLQILTGSVYDLHAGTRRAFWGRSRLG